MFDLLVSFFNIILYQPLFNALIFLYQHLPGHDFGIAVIVLTVLIRFALYPLASQGIRSQKALSSLQPKMKEIQEKFKNDKAKLGKEMMELYQKEKINPFSGCLPLLIQMPILLALFLVFKTLENGLEVGELQMLYSFVPYSDHINTMFLGILDLTMASMPLAILTGLTQYYQVKMMMPSKSSLRKSRGNPQDFSQMMQKQMLYFFPAFTVLILWQLPSAIALYWIITTLFTIFQQRVIFNKAKL